MNNNFKFWLALTIVLATFTAIFSFNNFNEGSQQETKQYTSFSSPAPREFYFSNTVIKESDSALPTKEELEAYQRGLNG